MKNRSTLIVLLVVVAIQFVPVDRTNPPVMNDLHGPTEVRDILVRSCYDCHSNQTRWPWYSKVAPMSWLVAKHVKEGREEMNFSDWNTYSLRQQQHLAVEALEAIEKREMPMPVYMYLHGESKLTGSEIQTLRGWRP